MADIQSEILGKYGIDIAQENVFKLYKLDSADISAQELETKIRDARKRWETSINGANEKNAERDRARLEKAEKYERILRDDKLRKMVFHYYNHPMDNTASGSGSPAGSTEFAKEYFKLIKTTKKVKQQDIDFFFKYYHAERKNKQAILEMLSKDLKINVLGKKASNDDEAEDSEGKKKDDASPVIANLFQEATVLKLKRAIEKFEEAQGSNELCMRYPKLREGLYQFLEIKDINNAKDFTALMSEKGKAVYAVRQERGAEYVSLVDLFNILQAVGEYQDVADNIAEFKLLLKYPTLTPYMFSFVEMKPETMKGIINVANRDYKFRDDTDFILNYYQPVHDNFGISNGRIGALIRNAEKKAKQNKILNEIDEKLGRNKQKRNGSIGTEIIHWLVYWPIFAVYFIFEAAKTVFTKLHMLVIPVFIALFGLSNWLIPKKFEIENLLVLRKIVFKAQWLPFLDDFLGGSTEKLLGLIVLSLAAIILLLIIYVSPALFGAMFIAEFADDFNKRFDWIGYERTFQNILQMLKQKTQDQYAAQKNLFLKNKIPKIIMNIMCLALFLAIICLAPSGMRKLSEVTGYGQKEAKVETAAYTEAHEEEETEEEGDDEDPEKPVGDVMVISTDSANIRSGPGTDYSVVTTARLGDLFVATGNEETASNGRIWYEIYLDDEMTQTGWASQKVIEYQ